MSKNVKCPIKMYVKIKKHYGKKSIIKCNHPKGEPFNPKNMLATTLGLEIERVMLQFVRLEN
jgi:hypothetical protein